MKQKTRFKNFGNIGIGLKKAISVDLSWKGRHFYGRPRAALSLATPLCDSLFLICLSDVVQVERFYFTQLATLPNSKLIVTVMCHIFISLV